MAKQTILAGSGVFWNDEKNKINSNFSELYTFRGALVKQTVGQALNNHSSIEIINFNAEEYDTDSFHDNVTNNSRLTIPAGVSKVRLIGAIGFSAVFSANAKVRISKNGVAGVIGLCSEDFPSGGYTNPHYCIGSAVVEVVEGDYFELTIYKSANGTTDTNYTWFAIEVVEAGL